ncbi:hypothetical protein [Marinobacterium lacunae]|nr:hypothetical protein [Marinobacterium lacunae]
MNAVSKGIIISCLVFLTACASPLTKKELETLRTVGVVNEFPEYPNFTNIGTTVFNNEYDEVNDSTLKQFVTNEVVSQINSRGYSAIEISDKVSDADVDLVMVIVPRDIYNMIDTYGYGFYQRSMFSANAFEKSYVALNLRLTTNGNSRCDTCYGQSLTELPIDEMPAKWSELEDSKKKEFINILKQDIKSAVAIAFNKTGL